MLLVAEDFAFFFEAGEEQKGIVVLGPEPQSVAEQHCLWVLFLLCHKIGYGACELHLCDFVFAISRLWLQQKVSLMTIHHKSCCCCSV